MGSVGEKSISVLLAERKVDRRTNVRRGGVIRGCNLRGYQAYVYTERIATFERYRKKGLSKVPR